MSIRCFAQPEHVFHGESFSSKFKAQDYRAVCFHTVCANCYDFLYNHGARARCLFQPTMFVIHSPVHEAP